MCFDSFIPKNRAKIELGVRSQNKVGFLLRLAFPLVRLAPFDFSSSKTSHKISANLVSCLAYLFSRLL